LVFLPYLLHDVHEDNIASHPQVPWIQSPIKKSTKSIVYSSNFGLHIQNQLVAWKSPTTYKHIFKPYLIVQ
jgi:hypothetical protein